MRREELIRKKEDDTLQRSDGSFVIDWWVEYINGDLLERHRLVEDLPARKDMVSLLSNPDVDFETRDYASVSLLLALFDDAVETCYYEYKLGGDEE